MGYGGHVLDYLGTDRALLEGKTLGKTLFSPFPFLTPLLTGGPKVYTPQLPTQHILLIHLFEKLVLW